MDENFGAHIHPSDRKRVLEEYFDRVLGGEKYFYLTYRLKCKGGKYIWVRNDISVVKRDEDSYDLYLTHVDITSQKIKEKELADNARRLRAILDATEELKWKSNFNLAVSHTLDKIRAYFSADRAYIIEFDWLKNVSNNTYESNATGIEPQRDNLQEIPNDLCFEFIKEFETKGFLYKNTNDFINKVSADLLKVQNVTKVLAVPIYEGGNLTGFLGVDNPSTNRGDVMVLQTLAQFIADDLYKNRLSIKVSNSEEMLKSMINNVPVGIGVIAVGKNAFYPLCLSEGYGKLTGQTVKEAFERGGRDAFGSVHPDDTEAFRETLNEVYNNKTPSFSFNYRLLKKDGNYFWARLSASLIKIEADRLIYYGIYSDISAEKNIVNKIRRQNDEYRIVVKQSNSQMFRYYVKKKTLIHDEDSDVIVGLANCQENIPESLYKEGIIAAESIEACKRFFNEIEAGKPSGHSVVKIYNKSVNRYLWFECTYTLVNDEKGELYALCTFTDISDKVNERHLYNTMLNQLSEFTDNMVTINLTKNEIFDVNPNDRFKHVDLKSGKSYDYMLDLLSNEVIVDSEKELYRKTFS